MFELTSNLCEIGLKNKNILSINDVEIFKYYFENDRLKSDELDDYDGKFTRREILSRYILLSVILDQGPDIKGNRIFLKNVINELYRKEIRILHRPIDFFKELNIAIDELLIQHDSIKKIRANEWALENNTNPLKYSLFFAQSQRGIVPNKVLDFAIHRIGVPLSFLYLLEKDLNNQNVISEEPLVEYIESYPSAELMTKNLKSHNRYGLGNAIGDKASHLFAKLYVSIFSLVKKNNTGWSNISYEVPFDSNAGRVLFRTGFLFELANEMDLIQWNVIQKGKGKEGKSYIRVTNLRNKKIKNNINENLFEEYRYIINKFFKENVRKTIKVIEIQRFPNLLIYKLNNEFNKNYSIADFDNGLINIGLKYCFNHSNPKCSDCTINKLCKGYKVNNKLIYNYTT
ncbi:MAG: hypothetical protein QMD25_00140 [Caldisericia bacterium]|nr:hypothetical protein [Caldisericia bacterium]